MWNLDLYEQLLKHKKKITLLLGHLNILFKKNLICQQLLTKSECYIIEFRYVRDSVTYVTALYTWHFIVFIYFTRNLKMQLWYIMVLELINTNILSYHVLILLYKKKNGEQNLFFWEITSAENGHRFVYFLGTVS